MKITYSKADIAQLIAIDIMNKFGTNVDTSTVKFKNVTDADSDIDTVEVDM